MKVLVAEDESVSRRILIRSLEEWGYQPVVAQDGDQAWEILQQQGAPSLVVMDWEMPGRDGIDICRDIRAGAQEPYTYILLLTARKDRKDVIQGLQAGADDYITKPFNKPELKVRLRAGKRIVELQEKLIEARDTLRLMALHDPLTKLFNRGAILDRLDLELSRARRTSSPLAVIMADIDRFKLVNDTHGHLVGDEVLKVVADRLRSSARSYDSVGRYGGEEFLIVVPGVEGTDALSQAHRLHETIDRAPVYSDRHIVPVTMSMGLAVFGGQGDADVEALIHYADEALYRAKRLGRNRIEVAQPVAGRRESSVG